MEKKTKYSLTITPDILCISPVSHVEGSLELLYKNDIGNPETFISRPYANQFIYQMTDTKQNFRKNGITVSYPGKVSIKSLRGFNIFWEVNYKPKHRELILLKYTLDIDFDNRIKDFSFSAYAGTRDMVDDKTIFTDFDKGYENIIRITKEPDDKIRSKAYLYIETIKGDLYEAKIKADISKYLKNNTTEQELMYVYEAHAHICNERR